MLQNPTVDVEDFRESQGSTFLCVASCIVSWSLPRLISQRQQAAEDKEQCKHEDEMEGCFFVMLAATG